MAAEPWLRRFLLATAGAIYLASAVDLFLVGHYEAWQQVLPFGMIGVGVLAVGWAWGAPGRASLLAARWAGVLAAATALAGVYWHVAGNLAFSREVTPNAKASDAAWDALSGGNPLLAPGMIALAGLLAAAATYRHPALAAKGPRPPAGTSLPR